MNLKNFFAELESSFDIILATSTDLSTYSQIGIIVLIYAAAYIISNRIRLSIPVFKSHPEPGVSAPIKEVIFRSGKLLFPIFAIMLLRISLGFSELLLEEGSWVMKLAFSVALLLLFYSFVRQLVTNKFVAVLFRWIGLPIVFLHVIGLLDDVILVLESMLVFRSAH